MSTRLGRVGHLAETQRNLVAAWQMRQLGLAPNQIKVAVRGWRSVYRGVYALGDLDDLGWLRAATLIAPGAVLSHGSALALLGVRDEQPPEVHITLTERRGLAGRDGIVIHRPRRTVEWGHSHGIPVTSPTQSLKDAKLPPAELFHAIDRAESMNYDLTLPSNAVTRLQQATMGRTKSPAEAAFVLLCHQHDLAPPLVNHRLNGFEADFHWPEQRLVVEVDGWEFHKERAQFEEDRRRGLVHNAHGYAVTRVSAGHVAHDPALVAAAVAARLSAHARPRSTKRRKPPK